MNVGWQAVAIVVAAVVVSLLGGWAFTAAVLHLADRERRPVRRVGRYRTHRRRRHPAGRRNAPTAPRAITVRTAPPGPSVLRGGLAIGLLERAAVTLALVAGQSEAVAVVVAVKGLGRFSELRDNPGASERFVIGSLASLLWAAVIGSLTRTLLT